MAKKAKKDTAWSRFRQKKPVAIALRALGVIGKCLLTIFLIGVITVSVVGCVLVVYVAVNFDGSTGLPDISRLSVNETSVIYVRDSADENKWVPYQELSGANSIYKELDSIPLPMQQAVVAIEDETFWENYGVNWKRTIAAVANLVLEFNETEFGGSTITQQLIKVTTGDTSHSIERKINEIFKALYMEKHVATKEQILEAYLNYLPLSDNMTGVGAGARYFFAKDLEELTIAECAMIAGITNNPTKYNPYQHPALAYGRQRTVLLKMYELGFITEAEYRQARNEEIVFKNGFQRAAVQDYYVDYVIEDVIADLMETYGYSYTAAEAMVVRGGLDIYSAEDPAQQKAVESVYANEDNFPKHLEKDTEDPQACIFIVDYNGRLVATVGGRGEKTANRAYNRSTQAVRQPGSSLKPLTVYCPGVDLDIITYSTVFQDAPILLRENTPWPLNYGMKKPAARGNVLINYAIAESLNTIAVQIIEKSTPRVAYTYATEKFGLSTLVSSRQSNVGILSDIDRAPMAMGGLTDGVKAAEMAEAYSVFGSGGTKTDTYSYYRVEQNGETLLSTNIVPIRAISEDTAYVMNRLMQGVVRQGTALSLIGKNWSEEWELFGKTGTTTDSRDVYYCGGTPYFVGASWFGYDNNTELTGQQTYYARRLWNASMKALHEGLAPAKFTKTGTTEEHDYCTVTGLLAGETCEKTARGVYKATNVPPVCNGGTDHMAANALSKVPIGGSKPNVPYQESDWTTTAPEVSGPTGEGDTSATGEGGTTGTATAPTTAAAVPTDGEE